MSASMLAQSPLAWAVAHVQLRHGESFKPYPYQARILTDRSPRMLVLKARQVGISQVAAIHVAHEALHKPDSTTLVVSRDQNAAGHFLDLVYDVLDALPEPPDFTRRGVLEARLGNGARIVSQPATAKAGRGLTAQLVVLDEFAFAEYDSGIFRAVQPTLSRGGRLVVISTPDGQGNLFYRLWQGQEGGDWSRHRVHWRDCPAFDTAWYERTRETFTAADWASEYECDFAVSGEAVFDADDVDAMRDGWEGLKPYDFHRRYLHGWDIGRRRDATVGITVDATEFPYQVVAYQRLMRAPYAQIQAAIDARFEQYNGETFVESNSIGDPVIEGLTTRVTPFVTTAKSKADALTRLARLIENGQLKCGVEQVLSELKSYQWDDSRLVQDSVMALAIAMHTAEKKRWIIS